MITAIDTNILLDILTNDKEFSEQSVALLQKQSQGRLIISPLVYTELLVFFIRQNPETANTKINEFLHEMDIEVVELTPADFDLAAVAWSTYLQTKRVLCPRCQTAQDISCTKCGHAIHWRNHILTDFLIGSHAQNNATVLATRDGGYYKKYFTVNICG